MKIIIEATKTELDEISNAGFFSKDIEAVEEQIPSSYVQQGRLALTLLMTIVTIIILDVYLIIPLVPIMIIYIVCQVRCYQNWTFFE